VCLDQFRPEDLDVFYARLPLGPRSKAKFLEWLRGFFQYAVNRDWLSKSPVSRDLKPPKGAARAANKMPFTDEQLEDIIQACDQVEFREQWGNRWGTGNRSGDDLKDFIWTLTYTGLRISDVVLFDMERVQGQEVFLRAKKDGGDVFTLIPDWLRQRLHARALLHRSGAADEHRSIATPGSESRSRSYTPTRSTGCGGGLPSCLALAIKGGTDGRPESR
jgi:hypothetical protein